MASALTLARAAIRDAILAEVAALPPWRIHEYPPAIIAAPCVWVDMPAISRAELFLDSSWPVIIVVDGSDRAQVAALDDGLAVLWDALNGDDGMAAIDATAITREVGGPTLRAMQLTVSVPLALDTLCFASLSDAISVPP